MALANAFSTEPRAHRRCATRFPVPNMTRTVFATGPKKRCPTKETTTTTSAAVIAGATAAAALLLAVGAFCFYRRRKASMMDKADEPSGANPEPTELRRGKRSRRPGSRGGGSHGATAASADETDRGCGTVELFSKHVQPDSRSCTTSRKTPRCARPGARIGTLESQTWRASSRSTPPLSSTVVLARRLEKGPKRLTGCAPKAPGGSPAATHDDAPQGATDAPSNPVVTSHQTPEHGSSAGGSSAQVKGHKRRGGA